MSIVLSIALLVLMAGALITVPLGLPGVWIMVVLLVAPTWLGHVSWTVWLALAGLTLVSEAAEFLVLKKVGSRFGASGKAFWGAVAGGIVGTVIGMPIPVIGSIMAGLLGTFVGGGLVSFWETCSLGDASRVGTGVVLARTFAVGLKVGIGVIIMVVTVAALLI